MSIERGQPNSVPTPPGDGGELSELRETEGVKRTITEGGLPELVGLGDLDAARAERTRILMEADDALSRLRSDATITEAQVDTAIVSPRQVTPEQVHAAEAALNRLRNQTDAAWWTSQSGRTAGEILSTMMAQQA